MRDEIVEAGARVLVEELVDGGDDEQRRELGRVGEHARHELQRLASVLHVVEPHDQRPLARARGEQSHQRALPLFA